MVGSGASGITPTKFLAVPSGAEAAVRAGPEVLVRIADVTATTNGLRPGEDVHHFRAFHPATSWTTFVVSMMPDSFQGAE